MLTFAEIHRVRGDHTDNNGGIIGPTSPRSMSDDSARPL